MNLSYSTDTLIWIFVQVLLNACKMLSQRAETTTISCPITKKEQSFRLVNTSLKGFISVHNNLYDHPAALGEVPRDFIYLFCDRL